MITVSLQELISNLSLEQKASLCSGQDFWQTQEVVELGIPSILLTDGPHGVRKQVGSFDNAGLGKSNPATCFPTAVTTGSSWDTDLLESIGLALGKECRFEEISVLLGPGVNIKRNPLGGRNFEYFSEDPLLAGKMAAAWIKGIQSQGIGASLKHFIANNQEFHRMVIDTLVDNRTLREIYLAAFEYPIRFAEPWTIMSSYNKLNGTYLSDNHHLITSILRNEWKYNGLVMTDWGAMNDRVEAIKAGTDLEMPGSGGLNDRKIVQAVQNGLLEHIQLDDCARRVLELVQKAWKTKQLPSKLPKNIQILHKDNHQLAQEAAERSIVLLKNTENLLPLSATGTIGVIGAFAQNMRYQGAGSSQINPTNIDQPWDSFQTITGVTWDFAKGFELQGDTTNNELENQAENLAKRASIILFFAGLPQHFESEGFDRDHMDLPTNQVDLLHKILKINSRVVLILQNGSPVSLPFVDSIPAILEMYLAGQAGGSALTKILFGQVDPGGRLAETFPKNIQDCLSSAYFPGKPRQVQYREGIWIGYRYFVTAQKEPAFCFGHGLSYTSFHYSEPQIAGIGYTEGQVFNGNVLAEFEGLTLRFTIENTGSRPGWEVAQVYIRDRQSSVHRPERELKGFSKVYLESGEKKTIDIPLGSRSFSYWNDQKSTWTLESGVFDLLIGSSCQNIHLELQIDVQGNEELDQFGLNESQTTIYTIKPGITPRYSSQDFEKILNRPVPPIQPIRPFHLNSTIGEIRGSLIGKIFVAILLKYTEKGLMSGGADEAERRMFQAMMREMPLRSLVLMGGGKLSPGFIQKLLWIMNRI